MLGHTATLFLVFWGPSILWLDQLTFPPTVWEGSLFFTLFPVFVICKLFNDSRSDWCEVVPHCSFDLHFPRGWDGWMASPTWRTWVWVNPGSWWWTGRPGVLWFMGSQSQTRLSNWTEMNWTELNWMISNVGHLFVYFWPLVYLLWRNVYSSPLPIFNQVILLLLSYRSSLYTLAVNLLSDIWFANIFSYSIGCLLILSIVSFDAQKF